MPPTTKSLLNVPPELVLEVTDHLPLDGVLALKLTHSRLDEILALDARRWNTTLSDCARLAIRTYLSPSTPKASHSRCILCKSVYPISLFKSSSSPACMPIMPTNDNQHADIVELPSRVCSWHVGRLARVVRTEPGGRNEWVSHTEEICMHCGDIQAWAKCYCKCESCSFRVVTTYTRYLNNDREYRGFRFWRDTSIIETPNPTQGGDGQLWVRETCSDSGASNQNLVINLPVNFES
ncbi:hypothetical protein EJ02DRAFT_425848 [Clathrospora elynae]|uniref:F-box domain-containing protein n=1 Tax=Clathrospora elynae TaxID=706981 RepID=A0A6A5SCG3_9PLEO|nr:hypothetical protein EJ02DRAFT_425848 [Clathrospora elynae]